MTSPDIQVRLLGSLEVQRRDGSAVAAGEWRTGKTMDLLRLLALSPGRPVRVSGLIDKLWPDVTAEHARGSLRTAASHIRRTVGSSCVVRQPEGLLLQGAWVDAAAFLDGTRRVQMAVSRGHHAQVLAHARSAEALYGDDFHAHDDDSDWARTEREHLLRARLSMLCDAAESALAVDRPRDALELASSAVLVDRSSESAHRLLMRAHASLGEIGNALRVFETFRAHLAEELGADPSQQTRDLHLRLLRGSDS